MAMKVTKPSKKSTKPKFDPGKSYEWRPEDEFILTGNEFGVLYNVLKQKAPEAKATLDIFDILHKLFEAGVEEGTILEKKDTVQ